MREFNIGDKVYWAKYGLKSVRKDCPICFGKREVVVILGNSDNIKTPCNYCGTFGQSTGYVHEYEFLPEIEEVTLSGKEIEENTEGKKIKYRYENYVLDNTDIFETKQDAEKRVQEKIKQKEDDESKRYEYIKKDKLMSLSWSVGYHKKQVREAQKNVEYHSKKVELVKSLISLSSPYGEVK